MKFMKSLLAMVLALTMLFVMAVPAFAATKDEAYAAAVKAGAPEKHLAELKNYLNVVSFTSAEYDTMIKWADRVYNIVSSYSKTMYGLEPSQLSEAQEKAVLKRMPASQRSFVLNSLVSLGNELGVKVKVELIGQTSGYKITATDKNGKIVTSSTNKPVVDTSFDYTALVVVMSIVLVAAASGVVIASRKVRN